MGRMNIETRTSLPWKNGFPVQDIIDRLAEEDISISWAALYMYMLLKKYDSRTIDDLNRAPRPRILQEKHYRFIDDMIGREYAA